MEKEEGFISTGSGGSMPVDGKLSRKSNSSYLGEVFHNILNKAEKWVLLAGKKNSVWYWDGKPETGKYKL